MASSVAMSLYQDQVTREVSGPDPGNHSYGGSATLSQMLCWCVCSVGELSWWDDRKRVCFLVSVWMSVEEDHCM